ncbi:hypothetical protein OHA21_40840 [Actinoplanes sp. NBC_00393]|uniref:hypothetical protein n=1 Tax=Actinoplanes sp. NBC_00393 TaxID=2975953 RepID=UPI002E1AEDEA
MRDHATFRIGLVMAAGAVLAGCAGATPSASAPSSSSASAPAPSAVASPAPSPAASDPSLSPSSLPTITKTAKPPKEPTDNLPTDGWVAGMVTRGGKGPCYGMLADDGQHYALYSTEGIELTKGSRVKALLEPSLLRIYCGPGNLMNMLEVETIK